jgi:hypothetical protein
LPKQRFFLFYLKICKEVAYLKKLKIPHRTNELFDTRN